MIRCVDDKGKDAMLLEIIGLVVYDVRFIVVTLLARKTNYRCQLAVKCTLTPILTLDSRVLRTTKMQPHSWWRLSRM